MRLYFKALSDGWKLTSKHTWLWFFGLFALFIVGNGGEFDLYFKNVGRLSGNNSIFSAAFWQQGEWVEIINRLQSLWTENWIMTLFMAGIFVAALLFVLYFVVISQIALIYAANQGQKSSLSFHQCIVAGNKFFWRALIINIISKLIVIAVLLIIAIPLFFLLSSGTYEATYSILASILLIPAVIIVSFLNKYAINYAVIDNEKIFPAIKKAFKLFGQNWLVSLEMALIIFILSLLLGLFILAATAIVLAPFLASSISTASAYADPLANILTVLMLAALVLIVGMVLAASIFSAWQLTSWTYLFKELTAGPKEGKLIRVLNGKRGI
ncbi:MAG: hypothetical protein WC752_01150 [Patescibacteria group bacterium]|jgi:hypothetical protein